MYLFGSQQRVQTAAITQGLKNVLLLNAFEMHLLIPKKRIYVQVPVNASSLL